MTERVYATYPPDVQGDNGGTTSNRLVQAIQGGGMKCWAGGGGVGNAAPKIEADKLRVDANNTVLADRDILDCKNLKAGPARNGQAPSTELIKKLIRCGPGYEQPSALGADGARTMDITQFTPGASHRWDRLVDRGSGATINTIVYTFRVKFNLKSFYHTFNQAETGVEKIFSCYVDDDSHQWYCGQYRSLKDGEKKMIQVTQ